MSAAISLLLPQLPPDAEVPPSEGDAIDGGGEFATALDLELATLPPELERPDPDTAGDEPIQRPPQTADAPSETSLPDELAENPNLPVTGIASEADRAGATGASGRPSTALRPQAAESSPAPRAAQAQPAATTSPAPDPQAARAQAEAAVSTRPDPGAQANLARTADGPTPRARFEATRHADPRSSSRADTASIPPTEAEAQHSLREIAPTSLESEPRALQASPAAPAPITPADNPALSWVGPTPPSVSSSAGMGPPNSGPPPMPPEGLPLQVEWLAERGGGRVRVQLHPPHLGHVELEVRTRGNEVEVVLNVGEAAAHAPLQAQRQSLSQALAAHDLELANFEVADREAGERRSQQQHSNSPNGSSREQTHASRSPAGQALAPNHSLTTVRSRDAGIDVRI